MMRKYKTAFAAILVGFSASALAGINSIEDSDEFESKNQTAFHLQSTLHSRKASSAKAVGEYGLDASTKFKWLAGGPGERAFDYLLSPFVLMDDLNSVRSDNAVTSIYTAGLRGSLHQKLQANDSITYGLSVSGSGEYAGSSTVGLLGSGSVVWGFGSSPDLHWLLGASYGYYIGAGRLFPVLGLLYNISAHQKLEVVLPAYIKWTILFSNIEKLSVFLKGDGLVGAVRPDSIIANSASTAKLVRGGAKLGAKFDHKLARENHITAELGFLVARRIEVSNSDGDEVSNPKGEIYGQLGYEF